MVLHGTARAFCCSSDGACVKVRNVRNKSENADLGRRMGTGQHQQRESGGTLLLAL
jgi:hypothetical protein